MIMNSHATIYDLWIQIWIHVWNYGYKGSRWPRSPLAEIMFVSGRPSQTSRLPESTQGCLGKPKSARAWSRLSGRLFRPAPVSARPSTAAPGQVTGIPSCHMSCHMIWLAPAAFMASLAQSRSSFSFSGLTRQAPSRPVLPYLESL